MRPLCLTLVAFLGGCTDAETWWASFPSSDGDRAAIVAIFTTDGPTLEALDLESESHVSDTFERRDILRLEWLSYAERLEELDVTRGPIRAAETGRPSRPIPAPRVAFHTDVTDGGLSEWRQGDPSPAIAAFEMEAAERCRRFVVRSLDADVKGLARFAFVAAKDEVVFATYRARAYVVRPDTTVELTMTPTVAVTGGVVEADGRIWVGAVDGKIYRATYDRSSLRLTPFDSQPEDVREIRWIAATTVGDRTEMFILDYFGRVLRFDGSEWQEIEQRGPSTKGGLVQLGPNEALYGSGSDTAVVHYKDGRRNKIGGDLDGVTMIHRADDGTVYIGRGQGHLRRRQQNGTFVSLGRTDIALDLYSFLGTPDGFLYGGANGFLGEFVEGVGYCPNTQPAGTSIRHIFEMGDGYLLLGDTPLRSDVPVSVIIRPI